MFSHMQEALTVAVWMAVAVFVLAAFADGRGLGVIRGMLGALAWTIDKVREFSARRRGRSAGESEADAESSPAPTRLSSVRSAKAAAARTANDASKARDTPTRSRAHAPPADGAPDTLVPWM